MTTARDLVTQAHRDIGALGLGQDLSPINTNEGFIRLNQMIGQWRARRWLVYRLATSIINADGSQFYTIGTGGDINLAVPPVKIESAFVRQPLFAGDDGPVDYPLRILSSPEEYNRIPQKVLASWPSFLWYDMDWPTLKLYVWPLPDAPLQLGFSYRDQLAAFATLDDVVDLPPEYEEAMRTNLALRLAPMFGKQMTPDYRQLAVASLDGVRTSNLHIQNLQVPSELVAGGRYNIFSDRNG
jgi:hypothetical protein